MKAQLTSEYSTNQIAEFLIGRDQARTIASDHHRLRARRALDKVCNQVLVVSPSTASALAPHAAEKSWVMFVQVNPPFGGPGPIKIEAVKGTQIASRLRAISSDNAYETMLIGLIESTTPDYGDAVAAQYAGALLHDGWYEATADLIAFIQHAAQEPINRLLAQAHPGGLSEAPVDIKDMAKILGVSEPTIRRMVKSNEIPYLRWGRMLRFVPADVVATLQRRSR